MHPTSDKNVFGGKWWRFDRYELKDGCIRPVEGLPVRRYEPWDGYRTPHGKEVRKQPYHSLLELIGNIDSGELDQIERDLEIVNWCGRHGLLGALLPTTLYAAPGFDAALSEVPLLGTLSFDVEDSSAHLRTHSEPVETFLAAGRLLRKIIEQLQVTRDSKKSLKEKQDKFLEYTKILSLLVSSVEPVMFVEPDGHYGLLLACGSLLSHFTMMVLLDFTNNRPLICRNSKCGAFFVTKSTEARYCSKRCRGAVQIRKYRKRIARNAKGNIK